ncbi:hypothetical protein AURDEDRAFT_111798 [Auricularia subglabra TFB-10046 SS5]|nr:hypothetical protein AURDEDRAFT_111798 [Auricularia subglabra TFB-10046 SS5]
MATNRLNSEGILLFEHPFARVPYENLRKGFRASQKHIEREMGAIQTQLADLSQSPYDALSTLKALEGMISKVEGLQGKLESVHETTNVPNQQTLKHRLEHIAALDACSLRTDPEFQQWAATRLDRWLVDWALRGGRQETARQLAVEKSIEPLVDIELFQYIQRVEDALANHSCTEALAWCSENKVALRKAKSTLEFDFRLQEYIELCRQWRHLEAIQYWRKYLRAWQETHGDQIERACGLLCFSESSNLKAYRQLYDTARWARLAESFRLAVYELYSIPKQPIMLYAIQAGLSSLKVPPCMAPEDEDHNIDCPVCDKQGLGGLAPEVPSSHQVNSTIVCKITGRIMEGDNSPMVFPNGNVYSKEALEIMAAENDGNVTDPRTGETVPFSLLRKVFIT